MLCDAFGCSEEPVKMRRHKGNKVRAFAMKYNQINAKPTRNKSLRDKIMNLKR